MRFMAGLDDLGSFLSWMNLSRAEEMDSSPVCVLPGRQAGSWRFSFNACTRVIAHLHLKKKLK